MAIGLVLREDAAKSFLVLNLYEIADLKIKDALLPNLSQAQNGERLLSFFGKEAPSSVEFLSK